MKNISTGVLMVAGFAGFCCAMAMGMGHTPKAQIGDMVSIAGLQPGQEAHSCMGYVHKDDFLGGYAVEKNGNTLDIVKPGSEKNIRSLGCVIKRNPDGRLIAFVQPGFYAGKHPLTDLNADYEKIEIKVVPFPSDNKIAERNIAALKADQP